MGRLLFLGTGASMGIPVVGCNCEVCHSPLTFNQRLRPSVLIKAHFKQFLIDVGPDFRFQALSHKIHSLDGVLLTHAHQDHTAGIDDLRPIYYKRITSLPLLLSKETSEEIERRYRYLLTPAFDQKDFVERLHLQLLPISLEGEIEFGGVKIGYVTYEQGGMSVNGFRFGDLAYLSDIRTFPDTIFQALKGLKILVISALRYTSSPLHFSIDEAIDFANKIGVEKVWLTHISHELEHDKVNAYLPKHVKLAYDGLEIEFNDSPDL
jgi:phosphoribosyl 1,2-cyclic phosphate phosphodiesterase